MARRQGHSEQKVVAEFPPLVAGKPIRHQVANPGPLGLYGFGLTTILLQGAVTTITEPQPTENLTFAYGLAFGGLVQLLAGQWEFFRNNTFAATAFSSYGAFWLGFSIYGILGQMGVWNGQYLNKPHDYSDTKAQEMYLSLWGFLTFFFFIVTLRINRGLQALFFTLFVLFFLLVGGLRNVTCHKFAGWWGIVVGAIAFYIATAELLVEVWGRSNTPSGDWMPLGRYQPKDRAGQALQGVKVVGPVGDTGLADAV